MRLARSVAAAAGTTPEKASLKPRISDLKNVASSSPSPRKSDLKVPPNSERSRQTSWHVDQDFIAQAMMKLPRRPSINNTTTPPRRRPEDDAIIKKALAVWMERTESKWIEFDEAGFILGQGLGCFPMQIHGDEWQQFKWVFWTENPVNQALTSLLLDLSVDDQSPLIRRSTPSFQFKHREEPSKIHSPILHGGSAIEKRVVVGIDFGTTHFSYAYASCLPPQRVVVPGIPHKTRTRGMQIVEKQPCACLLDSNMKVLEVGIKARAHFLTKMAEKHLLRGFGTGGSGDGHEHDYLFFDAHDADIKMRLFSSSPRGGGGGGDRSSLDTRFITSLDGRHKIKVETLVGKMLEGIARDALMVINSDLASSWGDDLITYDHILWVLSVPNIWNEAAKKLMRRAAVLAGLTTEGPESTSVAIALEPDCVALAVHANAPEKLTLKPNDRILIFDCGGGTVDVCAIRVDPQSNREKFSCTQLLGPSGLPMGGSSVDHNFHVFLCKLMGGEDVWQRFKSLNPAETVDLFDEWEEVKTSMTREDFNNPGRKKTLPCTLLACENASLSKLCKAYNAHETNHDMHVHAKSSVLLELPCPLIVSFFEPVIDGIMDHARALFRNHPQELGHGIQILLAGGLTSCPLLRDRFDREFGGGENKLLFAARSSVLEVWGAVVWGLQTGVIHGRKAALTLGLKASVEYDSTTHIGPGYRANKVYDRETKKSYIKNVFKPFVVAGQEVVEGQIVRHYFAPASETSDSIKFDVYCCDDGPPTGFVTDDGCRKLGTIIVPVKPGGVDANGKLSTYEVGFMLSSSEVVAHIKKLGSKVDDEVSEERRAILVFDDE